MKLFDTQFKDFLATRFPSGCPVIVWSDYTDMTRECLLQAADIARRVPRSSIFRITVPAETPVRDVFQLGKRIPPHVPSDEEHVFHEVQRRYRDDMAVDGISFDQKWFTWDYFSDKGFPLLLTKMILAVIVVSCSRSKTFLPLHAVKYSDGTIMLSLTGIFCHENERKKVLNHFKAHCTFYNGEDLSVDEIDVPVLTTKERLKLEKRLPTLNGDGVGCVRELGYLVEGDASDTASARKMQHYERYYRFYPYFGRVIP